MIQHLKQRKYYEDRYDRHTVEQARWYESKIEEDRVIENGKKIPGHFFKMLNHFMIYYITGDRWKNREETIKKWMDDDRGCDEMYENTPLPKNIVCFMCDRLMEFMDKYLHSGLGKERNYMEFYFCCNACHVGIKIIDGNQERIIPWMCPKCKRRMKSEEKVTKEKIFIKDWCEYCGYKNKHEFDLSRLESEENQIDPEEENKFSEDKLRFCITDAEGREYLESVKRLEDLKRIIDEIKTREEQLKLKLKKNPKGFPLIDRAYTCSICNQDVPTYDNWYDKYGIKCMTCQHALERKNVPLKYFKNTDSWYPMWQLKNKFGIHSQTAKKLIREGKLKAYVIPKENGSPYYYIFPKVENHVFFQTRKQIL